MGRNFQLAWGQQWGVVLEGQRLLHWGFVGKEMLRPPPQASGIKNSEAGQGIMFNLSFRLETLTKGNSLLAWYKDNAW